YWLLAIGYFPVFPEDLPFAICHCFPRAPRCPFVFSHLSDPIFLTHLSGATTLQEILLSLHLLSVLRGLCVRLSWFALLPAGLLFPFFRLKSFLSLCSLWLEIRVNSWNSCLPFSFDGRRVSARAPRGPFRL